MRITLKQLEVLVGIAKHETMSQAAEQLNLTQAACSKALTNLESQLKGTLFNRVGKKLVLNERGRMLVPKVESILIQTKELQDLMLDSYEQNPVGHLLIGASTTIGRYVLPTIISNFMQEFPKTKISLAVANTEQVIKQVSNFEIDIGFIEGNCYASQLEIMPWIDDQLVIIAAVKHELATKSKVTLIDLKSAQWILRERGSGTLEQFEIAMRAKVLPFLELSDTEAIKSAVQTGAGISCVSKLAVNELLNAKKLIQLHTPFLKLTRKLYILLHKEKYQTSILRTFLKRCS